MKLSDLKKADYNPRRISAFDFANLKKSIADLGDLSGLVWNRRTQRIVGGHQRKEAYQELGGTIVIVEELKKPNSKGTIARGHVTIGDEQYAYREVDWDEQTEKLANLAANRVQGEWDQDKLAELIFELKDIPELPAAGFSQNEITEILATVMDVGDDSADLTPPEAGKEKSKLGDVYKLGDHRVVCGDAGNPIHMDALMASETAEMVFTDPPYNVDYAGGASGKWKKKDRRPKILNDKMEASAFYTFLFGVCQNLLANCNGSFYICMSSSELHTLYNAFTAAGGHWQTYIIWAKNQFTLTRSDYQRQYEPVVYGLSDAEASKFDDPEAQVDSLPILYGYNKHEWFGGRKQGDVWMIDRPSKSPNHPTEKPITLMARAIRNSSKRGSIVLDTFGGSGGTLIAAHQLQRRCFMMELDPRYVDVIIRRWEQVSGKKAELLYNVEDEEAGRA